MIIVEILRILLLGLVGFWRISTCFVLKSGTTPESVLFQSTIPPSVILASSRNVLNIRSGLPRGVFPSLPRMGSFSSSESSQSTNESIATKTSITTTVIPSDQQLDTTTSSKYDTAVMQTPETSLDKTDISDKTLLVKTKPEAHLNVTTSSIYLQDVSTTQSFPLQINTTNSSSISPVPESDKSNFSITNMINNQHTILNVSTSTLGLSTTQTSVADNFEKSTPISMEPLSFPAIKMSNLGITILGKSVVTEQSSGDGRKLENTTPSPMQNGLNTFVKTSIDQSTVSARTTMPVSTISVTLSNKDATFGNADSTTVPSVATTYFSTTASTKSGTSDYSITYSSTKFQNSTPTVFPSTTVSSTLKIESATREISSRPVSLTTTLLNLEVNTKAEIISIGRSPATTPEVCDRSVRNLICLAPNYDNRTYVHCSWDSQDGAVYYSAGTTYAELVDPPIRFIQTNLTSYDFSGNPGKRYDIKIAWLKSLNDDLVNCETSSFILDVPYEKPKLKNSIKWLDINSSTMTLHITNPFYQKESGIVRRLSIDLTIPGKNSLVICKPASWYDVALYDINVCDINSLGNATINQLTIILNASSDPLGKDPQSFESVKELLFLSIPDPTQPNGNELEGTPPSSQPVVDNAAVAGGGAAAGVFVGLIIVFVLIILVRRHRRNSPKQTWQANITMAPSLALAEDAFAVTQNLPHSEFSSGAISADKFGAFVANLERNSGLGYASLWEDARLVGLQNPCTYAELPANRLKNRFTNVLPYDASRVVLRPWPVAVDEVARYDTGDYINANFVPGLRSEHEYIATQGPLPRTISDFWRAIWQHRVCAVVMLTKLKESGVRKCEYYWPPGVDSDTGDSPFGPLNVQLVSQSDEVATADAILDRPFDFDQLNENSSVWTIRDFRLSLSCDDGSIVTRALRQFHFMDWPDQGVPAGRNREHLLRFIRLVRSQVERDSGKVIEPILVHCSAGVGRTGAFIAMDILLQDLAAGKPLDVNSVVCKLREYRQLVQTEQQYKFIYELLLEAINGTSTENGAHLSVRNGLDFSNRQVTMAAQSRRRNKGNANCAYIEDDENAPSQELDDRV